ncbi:MAG: hypothetical protein WCP65_01185 [Bacteroidota bacterium]
MSTLELKVYEIFKSKFSEQEAATVIEYFEAKTEQKFSEKKDVFLTKQDKIDLIEKIETSKTDIVKWMFTFWIGTIGIAVLFYLLKK